MFSNGEATNEKTRNIYNSMPRVVGFSNVISNPIELSEWMKVPRKTGLFCFGEEALILPIEPYIVVSQEKGIVEECNH